MKRRGVRKSRAANGVDRNQLQKRFSHFLNFFPLLRICFQVSSSRGFGCPCWTIIIISSNNTGSEKVEQTLLSQIFWLSLTIFINLVFLPLETLGVHIGGSKQRNKAEHAEGKRPDSP